jgi:hypothetical protein
MPGLEPGPGRLTAVCPANWATSDGSRGGIITRDLRLMRPVVEPPVVERVDHVTHVVVGGFEQVRDVRRRLALGGHQHDDRPAQLHRVFRGTGDPLQPLAFGITSHTAARGTACPKQPQNRRITRPTYKDEALASGRGGDGSRKVSSDTARTRRSTSLVGTARPGILRGWSVSHTGLGLPRVAP